MSDLKAAGYSLHGFTVDGYSPDLPARNKPWYILQAISPQRRKVMLCHTVSFETYCGKVEEWLNA